jgi:cytoskeletal protein CcmA (bactofilin family)
MKAKRIVSILLTGSMLLSLLPVSALAAAPVFDAPAQTTAKKAAPLVQEADASRSTEEEAATRSSRDLDAENSTSDSFTIDLNAGGMPESEGDYDHWFYSANSTTLFLYDGTFTLQPSSDPEAASALQADLDIGGAAEFNSGTVGRRAYNEGTISDGTFQGNVNNNKTISDGTFQGEVYNHGTISGGTFQGSVYNSKDISGGTFQKPVNNYGGTISGGTFEEVVEMNESPEGVTIEGGTFKKGIELNAHAFYPTIIDGLFDGKVSAAEGYSGTLSISGGLFTKAVDVSNITNLPNLQITGGYFVNEPTMPEGSDTGFTTVSDQNGRTFQVPVNGGFSKNGYEALYVPHGMSERQANPITVKTDTALTDCLADGVSIMETDKVQKNDDGSYTIEVYQPESIVLVTEKPAPPTPDKPDEPGDEIDPGFSSGAAALGIVLGAAGLGYLTYAYGSSLYLHYALPGGFIPSTRQELANVLWTTAGKPDPVSTALYTDIPADAIEQQKAARWCVEQGLLSDYGATFGPDTKVTNARIIRAWNSLKKVPVPITN